MKEIELSYERERPDRAFDRTRALRMYNDQDETRLWLRQLEPPEDEKPKGNAFFAKKSETLDLSEIAELL